MSSKYSSRPSDLLGITCDIQSFYLDRACWLYGSQLDVQIENAVKNAKNDVAKKTAAHQALSKAMSKGRQKANGQGQAQKRFRDPALI